MKLTSDPKVKPVFDNYPENVRHKMLTLRELVLETAEEIDGIEQLEETLKWGEPSFLTKKGSTLRMDWKPKNPQILGIYFSCSTRLVETFRVVFNGIFRFEGKRAILLPLNAEIPKMALKQCIKATLTYHQVKELPTLGI